MTVETTNSYSGPLLANGSTKDFPFTFKAFGAEEISVYIQTATGGEILVDPASYSVTIGAEAGGTVSFYSAPASARLFIVSEPDMKQEIGFQNNSAWLAEPHNESLDRAAVRNQAARREAGRALRVPLGEFGPLLPFASDRARKVLVFDENGNPKAGPYISSVLSVEASIEAINNAGINAARAELAAQQAADSAATAEAFAGPTFGSTSAGIAGTNTGEFFAINVAGLVSIYQNVAGVAVFQRSYYTGSSMASSSGAGLIGSVGGGKVQDDLDRVMATRAVAASRSLSALVTGFTTLGYASVGDGGGASYRRVASQPAHGGKVQSADGAWWELAEAFPNVLQFGAKRDGVTDNAAIFQSAIAFGNHLKIPAGVFLFNSHILIEDKDFCFEGSGKDVTSLLWNTANSDGIRVRTPTSTYNSKSRPAVTISNLSLLSNVVGAGKAIDAVMTITETPNVYGDATTLTLENVDIRGDDHYSSNSKYWKYGIYMVDTGAVAILHCRLLAVSTVPNIFGIYIKDDTGSNMRFNITGGGIWSYDYGIMLDAKAPKTIEGVYITGYEIVGGLFGIRCIGGPIHALEFTNGHIDCRASPISFAAGTGSSALVVSGSYIQRGDKGGDWTPSGGYILDIQGVAEARIFGNNFLGDSSVSHYGVVMTGCANGMIYGNTFYHCNGAGVIVDATGSGTRVFGNSFRETSIPYAVSGNNHVDSSGGNFVHHSNGTKHIYGEAVVSLNASGIGTLTLPDSGFKNAIHSAIVSNGDATKAGAACCYLPSCTKTTLQIRVSPNPAAGDFRIGFHCTGN